MSLAGCRSDSPQVVVYCALDKEFASPVLMQFCKEEGIYCSSKSDVESTKTVGLAEAIIAESGRPRCDVFWNNEIMHTLRLQNRGLLEPYQPSAAADIPAPWRAADGAWHGFAARARVLLVNTERVAADRPKGIDALHDPRFRGRCGLAKPLAGTTATHAACLFAAWGDEQAKDWFRKLKTNEVLILSGNKQVARAVAAGKIDFGLTDTDDAIIEVEAGHPVEIVYPDQDEGGLGTLFIPNTVAIIRDGPHPEEARRLVDYLLRPETEALLAQGPSAQIPLNSKCEVKSRLSTPRDVRPMQVDFAAAAEKWQTTIEFLANLLAR